MVLSTSVRSKSYFRKTRRNNILKVVREHYLRDDIYCGIVGCTLCAEQGEGLLQVTDGVVTQAHPRPHYIVPDTNILLHQIDVLESTVFKNIIILSTVIEEVKKRAIPVYSRLRDMIDNKTKRVHVFVNEHCSDTYVERELGETNNDRNDRAIRRATEWYVGHIASHEGSSTDVVLLTDDVANKVLARELGLIAMSMEEYVKGIPDHPELEDKLSRKDAMGATSKVKSKLIYPPHLSPTEVKVGIREGKYVSGNFQTSRSNYMEGSVFAEGQDTPVLIKSLEHINRAMNGDVVVLEVFPEDQWEAPSEHVMEDTANDRADVLEAKPADTESKQSEKKATGRIVGIIRRKWRNYCGIILQNKHSSGSRHTFKPTDRGVPHIRIETRQYDKLAGQRIIVAIDSWPNNSRYPLGHFVRALGPVGDKDTENEVLLLEHDIPHTEFSSTVTACLPSLPWIITPEDEAARVDLRGITICSVDPPGCTDIDDALHARELENGNYEVGVHIADVSHFIRPGTAIDKEAANRCTSVYLCDKRIDMVPELLSSNLCSLRGGETRFAFSCVWEITKEAEIVGHPKFHKSIIKSAAALTYGEAQARIDDVTKQDEMTMGLRRLNSLAKILKQKRINNGALVLASTEVRFNVDSETHDPVEVVTKQLMDTNSMVEEFMLLGNISAAETIYRDFSDCALLRRHPSPPLSNFDDLVKAARSQGFELVVDSGKELALSLNAVHDPSNPYMNTVIRIMTTRCMMQAVYFASGTIQEQEFTHYGLACPIYTHFTSPIRRYADIIVHRLLAVSVEADSTYPELLEKKKCTEICNQINYRHKMAQRAGRASVTLHTNLFFKERVQDEEGYILFVKKNALQVLVPKYGLEGTLLIPDTAGFTYNEQVCTQSLGDVTLHQFDRITVQLSIDKTDIQHQKLMLKLVKPNIPGFSVPPITPLDTDMSLTATPPTADTTVTAKSPDTADGGKSKAKKRKSDTDTSGKKKKKKSL